MKVIAKKNHTTTNFRRMWLARKLAVILLFTLLFGGDVICEEQSLPTDVQPVTEGDAPIVVPGFDYGQFGKRPSGHSFVRFGKRDQNGKGHSMLYFGKRASPDERHFVELLQYLQRSQEPSWKRGHSIMRFGKRASEKHNFIRFGKREANDDDDMSDQADKRAGHSMMYFGKRMYSDDDIEKKAGHSMMYFGKRDEGEDDIEKKAGHSMMYFGKRMYPEDEMEKKAGHSMMYFGKRMYSDDDIEKKGGHSMMYFGKRRAGDDLKKKAGHSMMYFGKRSYPDDDMEKRAGHSMMYFGKRMTSDDTNDEDEEVKRTGHSMMYFGKRPLSDGSGKRQGHSMMYFGKRMYPTEEEEKRNGHSMMYFGKRDDVAMEDLTDDYGDLEEDKRASHSMLRFGKRQAGPYGGDGSWIHSSGPFETIANRYYSALGAAGQMRRVPNVDKKKHNMMHFGKRSVEGEEPALDDTAKSTTESHGEGNTKAESGKSPTHDRKKRDVDGSDLPISSFSPFIPVYEVENHVDGYDYPEESFNDLPFNSMIPPKDIEDPTKSKNVFLRFGKH